MPDHLSDPTSILFARTATIKPGERALLLHSGDPALADWLVDAVGPAGRVIALHTSHRALHRLAGVPRLELSDAVYPDPQAHGPADVALLDLPRGRDHVRAYLWTAAGALRPGGQLYLAGSNNTGARSAIRDAGVLFGHAPVLGFKGGCRIALATRPDALTILAEWAQTSPWQPQARSLARPEGRYTIVTMPGVFSWEHLDDGCALLLDHLGVEPGTDVLDIGCGTGIIGMAAARLGAAQVTLIDDNLLAVRCTRASIQANDLADRCTVVPGDVTGPVRDRQFDLVLSNPPFHEGREVATGTAGRIIHEGYAVLRPGGRLRIVANRFLPYDRVMRETFGDVTVIAATGRYYVLESVRR
ncbi:MAG TPA: class I SAM-dependent methyltransferase [Aggregatilineaceae bacterium]|nr:class I SAM-dependent methyltransferase [Aggregatilineaceae bacterium]